MQKITDFLEYIGIDLKFLIVGVLGSLISVMAKRKQAIAQGLPHQTLPAQLTTLFVGGMIANYITPIVIQFLTIGDKGEFGVAFVVGYLGMIAMERLIDKLNIKEDE